MEGMVEYLFAPCPLNFSTWFLVFTLLVKAWCMPPFLLYHESILSSRVFKENNEKKEG